MSSFGDAGQMFFYQRNEFRVCAKSAACRRWKNTGAGQLGGPGKPSLPCQSPPRGRALRGQTGRKGWFISSILQARGKIKHKRREDTKDVTTYLQTSSEPWTHQDGSAQQSGASHWLPALFLRGMQHTKCTGVFRNPAPAGIVTFLLFKIQISRGNPYSHIFNGRQK